MLSPAIPGRARLIRRIARAAHGDPAVKAPPLGPHEPTPAAPGRLTSNHS